MTARTPAGLLAAILATNPAQPLLTFYDDASGERTELSAVTLDNWVSKTANLLVDELGLGGEDAAAIALPPHWQTAAVLLGCWKAGLAVHHGRPGGGPGELVRAEVAFCAMDRLDEISAPETYGLSLAPMAMPLRDAPDSVSDYVLEVRKHGDFYSGPQADPAHPALTGLPGGGALSHAELTEKAYEHAASLGLTSEDRVLIAEPRRPLDWLLAPLAAGASVVLCRNADPAKLDARAESEKVTRRL
ncbi:TIGR03089 family protein [Longispora albida]|uniref:TIGR03089 family protein n=1 Tax=Longispora albida TaxID=203523 RepID=UPI0003675262|nr:TIGR03089 family protein [Longispora albida]